MRNEKVFEWLSEKGFADRVIDHTETIDTVEHAAIQLGCKMPYHMVDKTADELTEADIKLEIADSDEQGQEHSDDTPAAQ